MVLALDDRQQVVAAEAKVGAFVSRAAGLLDVVAQRLEELGDELLEGLGGQRGELSELQLGAAGLAAQPLGLLAPVADGLPQGGDLGDALTSPRGIGPLEVAIDLEQAFSIVLSSRVRSARVNWF